MLSHSLVPWLNNNNCGGQTALIVDNVYKEHVEYLYDSTALNNLFGFCLPPILLIIFCYLWVTSFCILKLIYTHCRLIKMYFWNEKAGVNPNMNDTVSAEYLILFKRDRVQYSSLNDKIWCRILQFFYPFVKKYVVFWYYFWFWVLLYILIIFCYLKIKVGLLII